MQHTASHISIHPDHTVIEKILFGEVALFELLIRRYNPILYKIARTYGFNHQDAEDLMQETHVTAYTSLSKLENHASYKSWICRIMVNKCNYKLKYGYYKNETPTEVNSDITPGDISIRGRENKEADAILNRELSVVLEKSIEQIPVIYRTVFMMRELEGFSVAETADLLGITEINVKVRLNRAKALIQKEIEQYYSRTELYSFNLIYCDAIVNRVLMAVKLI